MRTIDTSQSKVECSIQYIQISQITKGFTPFSSFAIQSFMLWAVSYWVLSQNAWNWSYVGHVMHWQECFWKWSKREEKEFHLWRHKFFYKRHREINKIIRGITAISCKRLLHLFITLTFLLSAGNVSNTLTSWHKNQFKVLLKFWTLRLLPEVD